MKPVLTALAAMTLAAGPAAAADGPTCAIPRDVRPARATPPPAHEVVRGVPTASYMLALTWSPEWCRNRARDPDARVQCRDNRFGFVVHGLWPNGGGKAHPRYCAPAPPLSVATVRANLCMTPSTELLQHEWAAHGTCGWTAPEPYFARAAELWRAIKVPPLAFAPGRMITAGDVRTAFTTRNPHLRRDSLFLKVGDGNRLQEVRVCYDLKFKPARCGRGLGAPDHVKLRIQPAGA